MLPSSWNACNTSHVVSGNENFEQTNTSYGWKNERRRYPKNISKFIFFGGAVVVFLAQW